MEQGVMQEARESDSTSLEAYEKSIEEEIAKSVVQAQAERASGALSAGDGEAAEPDPITALPATQQLTRENLEKSVQSVEKLDESTVQLQVVTQTITITQPPVIDTWSAGISALRKDLSASQQNLERVLLGLGGLSAAVMGTEESIERFEATLGKVGGLHRVNDTLSVNDVTTFGSAVSARGMASIGEGLSVSGPTKIGRNLSVCGRTQLGWSFSALGLATLGSSFSVRRMARAGSSLSLYGMARMGSSVSALDFVSCGSAMSVRSFLRCGSTLSAYGAMQLGRSASVLDFISCGSSLSCRGFSRCGSGVSLYGLTRLSAQISILDFGCCGSSCSPRGGRGRLCFFEPSFFC